MSERDIYDLDDKSMIKGRMISVELHSRIFDDMVKDAAAKELNVRSKTFIKNLKLMNISSIICHLEQARAILEIDDTQTERYDKHIAIAKDYFDCLTNKE